MGLASPTLRTMEGVNWQMAKEEKKPKPTSTKTKSNRQTGLI